MTFLFHTFHQTFTTMSKFTTHQILSLVLLFLTFPITGRRAADPLSTTRFIPAAGTIEYRSIDAADTGNSSRRMLAPFQLCLVCRCCAANDPSNCSSMPCCFGIDCNLPDKPYGVCAFVPKSCNCTSCA